MLVRIEDSDTNTDYASQYRGLGYKQIMLVRIEALDTNTDYASQYRGLGYKHRLC